MNHPFFCALYMYLPFVTTFRSALCTGWLGEPFRLGLEGSKHVINVLKECSVSSVFLASR